MRQLVVAISKVDPVPTEDLRHVDFSLLGSVSIYTNGSVPNAQPIPVLR
jgi:hypothetical protein